MAGVNQTSYTPYKLAYDGDDQQISATSPQNDSASYQYDADGHRVVKMTCSDPTPCMSSSSSLVTTIYVYDAMGQEAAEYSAQRSRLHWPNGEVTAIPMPATASQTPSSP